MKKRRIYVAGKLNDMAVDYLHNVHLMMETAQKVKDEGYSIFVPAIDLLMGIKFGYKDYHDYFDNNQPWIEVSDAIFLVPGWKTSSGTKKEITLAEEAGVPVFDDLEQMNIYFDNLDAAPGVNAGSFNIKLDESWQTKG